MFVKFNNSSPVIITQLQSVSYLISHLGCYGESLHWRISFMNEDNGNIFIGLFQSLSRI